MNTWTIVILMMFLVMFALFVVLFIRNNRVYRYRRRLLDDISNAAENDIRNHREWEWRYDAFRDVPYNAMFLTFWKRLDSFFPDKSFLDPEAVPKPELRLVKRGQDEPVA